jgi:hypothetical protein
MSLLTGTVAESLEKGSAGVTVGTTPGADRAYSSAIAVCDDGDHVARFGQPPPLVSRESPIQRWDNYSRSSR